MTITTTDKAYAIASLLKTHGIDKRPTVVDDDIHYSILTGYTRVVSAHREKKFVPTFEKRVLTRYQVLGIYHDLYGE